MAETSNQFFEKPILNSPYGCPVRHWELDESGQPTQQILENRRRAEFITPIPKPKKRKGSAEQSALLFDEGKGLSTEKQRYDHTAIINAARQEVDKWRALPNPSDWRVTPETARLLQHWRKHDFSSIRPFFCQIEAVETAIWLGGDIRCVVSMSMLTEGWDAKEKKSTMDTYWVPGVNNLGTHGRWAFAEFTEVYQIEADFEAKVKSEFDKVIESAVETRALAAAGD